MHKGRPYELEQMARVYSAQVPYGSWWPKAFICTTNSFLGAYSVHITSLEAQLDYIDVDRNAGIFEYRGEFASDGGKTAEGVLRGEIDSLATDIETTFQIEVDGVPQIASPTTVVWVAKWKTADRNFTVPVGLPGFELKWNLSLHLEAKPY